MDFRMSAFGDQAGVRFRPIAALRTVGLFEPLPMPATPRQPLSSVLPRRKNGIEVAFGPTLESALISLWSQKRAARSAGFYGRCKLSESATIRGVVRERSQHTRAFDCMEVSYGRAVSTGRVSTCTHHEQCSRPWHNVQMRSPQHPPTLTDAPNFRYVRFPSVDAPFSARVNLGGSDT